jgi:GDPmannose 4,6-dehydratase
LPDETRSALIVGAAGQDGRLLSEQLSERGYRWLGLDRTLVQARGVGWEEPVDITVGAEVDRLVTSVQPDEIYHLAAFHSSAEESTAPGIADSFARSLAVNVQSLVNFLDAMRRSSPASRLFYAASSHVFGIPDQEPQDENTPMRPQSIYGISKAAGLQACGHFRREHGVFASCGILYNHESHYRPAQFLSARIIDGALAIAEGRAGQLVLGNLDARVDWGFAPEYVDAMQRILHLDAADDFVIATGRGHTVREFAELAFAVLGLDWKRYLREDPSRLGRRTSNLVGNAAKLKRLTGWEARVDLPDMVRRLLDARSRSSARPG